MNFDAAAAVHLILGTGIFIIGAVVGSFLNVCIYRIPWQKSVIWPASRCPSCLGTIAATDNLPIVGWLALRGECRRCGARISPRYPLVELLVALLFVGTYIIDVVLTPGGRFGNVEPVHFVALAYHLLLVALLVTAAFIDADLTIIPDAVTVTGMVLGLALGTIFPEIRPEPSAATSTLGGLGAGLVGLLAGGGLVWAVRIVAGLAFRREAMGFGDVTLLAMIGAFLGWQAAVMTFFLAPFFGLAPAIGKIIARAGKRLAGRPVVGADNELPFGPYLAMAAVTLMLGWRWIWGGWAKSLFETLFVVSLYLAGQDR